MIYDSLNNRENYKELEQISKALDYLANLDLQTMPKEKTFLEGEILIANPLSFITKNASECVFEAHRKYIDVHCCYAGIEAVSIASADGLRETKPYQAEIDTAYYEGHTASTCVLTPGTFLVCFPEDVHRTGEKADFVSDIKKIVVKVLCRDDVE